MTNLMTIRARLYKCICGSRNLIVDNNTGWTEATVRCKNCKRRITGKNLDEAIKNWNKSFKQFAENENNKNKEEV